jgi:hypothetical protein
MPFESTYLLRSKILPSQETFVFVGASRQRAGLYSICCNFHTFSYLKAICTFMQVVIPYVVSFHKTSIGFRLYKADAVSCQRLIVKAWLQSQASVCEICFVWSGTGTGFPLSNSLLPYQYSASTPYSYFIPLPLMIKDEWNYEATLKNH